MAYATQITISTGSKVSVNYQSQEVQVGVTYQLEREDENLLQLVESKAAEVEAAHRRLWKSLKAERLQHQEQPNGQPQGTDNGYSQNGRIHDRQTDSGNDNGYRQNQQNGDGNGYHSNSANGSAMITEAQQRAVYALVNKMQMDAEEVERTLRMRFDKSHLPELTKRQASQFIDELQHKLRVKAR